MVKKILVPVDFSDYSEKVSRFAVHLAVDWNAEVKLYHVYYDPFVQDEMPDETATDPTQKITDKVLHGIELQAKADMRKLGDVMEEYCEKQGLENVNILCDQVYGFPEDAILQEAENYKADLIVMGTRGNTDASKEIFGSVAEKIIEDADLPVIVIPGDAASNKVKNLLYLTDFEKTDRDCIRWLLDEFNNPDQKIYIAHASLDMYEADEAALMEELQEHFSRESASGRMQFESIEKDDFTDAIDAFIRDIDIDLICMATHKRNFFTRIFKPSKTKKVLFHTHTALMVFHVG